MPNPKFLDAEVISASISMLDLVEPLKEAMIAITQAAATHPPRFAAPLNAAGRIGVMYGSLTNPPIHGAKILSLFPEAPALGLSSHQGFVTLFDSTDGSPLAICDADRITAMRTAMTSMVATRCLARPNPKIITICGAGEQAEWHIRASLLCFEHAEIRLWARNPVAASALRDKFAQDIGQISVIPDLKQAISGTDVIHTTTAAKEAFLPGAFLQAGQHVNLVGASLADSREIDDEGVARVSMFTDSLESASREAGELLGATRTGAISADYPVFELGQALTHNGVGRKFDLEITAYKSHGLIVQDLITAYEVYKRNI